MSTTARDALADDRRLSELTWAIICGIVRVAGRLEILREQVLLLAGGDIPDLLIENVRVHENELAARRDAFGIFARESLLLDGDEILQLVDPPIAEFLKSIVGAEIDPTYVLELESHYSRAWADAKENSS